MHAHCSAKHLVSVHPANRSGPAPVTSPVTPLSPTTVYRRIVLWHTPRPVTTTTPTAPAPTRCPGRRLSRTIPVPSHSPAAPPARWHTAAQAGLAPTHSPGRRLSRTIPVPSHSPAAPPAR